MIGVRQRRGQAFETMMLVISVIVAVAILGVLLGFLGGISFGATGARDTMKSLVSKVYQRGGGSEIAKKADFDANLRIISQDIIGETPIVAANVKFFCGSKSSEFCGGGSTAPMKVETTSTGGRITVNNKVSGAIAVCKAYSGTNAKNYNVCISSTDEADDAADTCDTKCT